MVKSEKLVKLAFTVVSLLAVMLFSLFFLCTAANADEPEPVEEAIPTVESAAEPDAVPADEASDEPADTFAAVYVDEQVNIPDAASVDEELLALCNVEYAGANKINFRLCLHGYELLPADATVTVTAYLPVANTVFYRSTFTKDYLVLKAAANITGGTTDGAILNLPADCVLKIEVNGTDIDGWDLIYGSTVEEAIIWHPSSGMTGVAADYVPGNATYFFMSNIGGHVVHLGINGANPSPPIGDNDSDDNDPSDPSGGGDGGDGNDPNDPSGGDNGGDGNDPNDPSGGDNGGDGSDPSDPSGGGDNGGGSDPSDPSGGDNGGDSNEPNDPSGGDNGGDSNEPGGPSGDNKDGGEKEPAETGDSRSIALMSVIAVISLTVLAASFRKKEYN
ncbi:MAG: hypothetical protein ACI3VK_02405 [Oscillospiraceae bacterium]